MGISRRRGLLLAAVQGVLAGSSFAAINASWVNPVDGSWTDPTAWSTNPAYPNNGQPNSTDLYNAVINASTGVPYTVTLSSDITINSLTVSSPEATLLQTGGTLRLVNGGATFSAGRYVLQSGTLTSVDPVTLSSRFDWNGGTLGGFGPFEVAPSALLNAATFGARTLSSTLNNRGTVYIGGTSITLNAGTFNNLAGGIISIFGSGTPFSATGNGTSNLISNSGLIDVDGAKPEVSWSAPLLNSGTINVYNGTLHFSGSSVTYTNGAVFSGSGTIDLGSGTHALAGTLTLAGSNVTLNSGTITGAGNLQINSVLNWGGGTISGTGAMNVAHGAALNFGSSSSTRWLARTLNNDGLINVSAGVLTLAPGAIISNQSDGVINISSSSFSQPITGGGSGGFISNAGLININIASSIVTLPQMINSGTINAQSGTASINFGTFVHNAGSTFTGAGTIDLGSGTHIVNGDLMLAGSNMRFNSGTFIGPGDINITGALSWGGGTFGAGGTLTGNGSQTSGALNVAPSGVLSLGSLSSLRSLARALNNSGTINVQSSSGISFSNGSLTNLVTGVINISVTNPFQLGSGTLNVVRNIGTINVDAGTLSVGIGSSVFVENSGTINAINGSLLLGTGTQDAGAFINGQGSIELTGFGTQTFNGPVTLQGSNFSLSNGTIQGAGDMLLRGALNWNSGTIMGAGIVDVSSSSVLNIASGSFRTLGRVVNDAGTINLNNASISLLNGAAINILPGGVMNLSGAGVGTLFSNINVGSLATITNHGQININGGTTNLSLGSFGNFINAGTINASNGTFALNGGVYTTGSIIKGNGLIDLTGNFGTVTLNDTLTLAGSSITLSNGTLMGQGNLAVNSNFSWGGGSILGPGAINIAPGSVMNVPAVPSTTRLLTRNISNAGTLNLLNTQPILVNGSITINNFPGAVMNIASPAPFSPSGQTGSLFTNGGVLNFTGLASSSYKFPFPLVDSGTINVSTGSLSFSTLTLNGGANITGAGFIDITSFPSTLVNGTVTLAGTNIHLGTGTLNGPGNIDVTGHFNWDAGGISGAGSIAIKPGGALNVGTGGFLRILSRTINNSGAINFTNGSINTTSGTINNLAGGVINVATFGGLVPSGGVNRLTNAGAINVAAGTFNVAIPFSNTGTVIVGSAGVASAGFTSAATFSAGVSQLVGSTLTRGNWIVHPFSTLSFGGSGIITDNAANVNLDGPDSNFPEINAISTNTGAFAITGGRAFTTSASYANSGLTVVGAQSVLTITGSLINTGTVDVDATGIINFAPPAPAAAPVIGTAPALQAIASQIASGYNNGAWNGPGINSDLAAAVAATPTPVKTAVGYALASDLGITGTFAGQPITSDAIVMRYTLYGDANLDLSVNALDFSAVASNFGHDGLVWSDGDFNYDGVVNTLDFNLMATNFNASMNSGAPASTLGALVPEPSLGCAFVVAGLAMRRRRHAAPRIK